MKIDGKTLRHSYNRNSEQKAIVMVSAWAKNSGKRVSTKKGMQKIE